MIGHYLLTLSEEQEDRVLTRTITPGPYSCGCLVGTANDAQPRSAASGYKGMVLFDQWMDRHDPSPKQGSHGMRPGLRYDALCERFGVPRINAAIRNRILSNRARRILHGASRDTAVVGAHPERISP